MTISHSTYDRVIDNNWDERPSIELSSGTPLDFDEITRFAIWCGKFTGKLKVQYLNRYRIKVTRA